MKKWPTVLALVIIYIAVIFGWNWVWGILFLIWTVPSLYSGEIHLVQSITKKENPILFWLIILTWLGLSALLILGDFLGWS